jgi:hypothetical protein
MILKSYHNQPTNTHLYIDISTETIKAKAVPPYAMKALGGRGDIARTHS